MVEKQFSNVAHKPPDPPSALILCGGKSTRMGRDKFLLARAGVAQWQRMAALAEHAALPIFLSCRKEQAHFFTGSYPCIFDNEDVRIRGPLRALLSAHIYDRTRAYLVIACDMPLLTQRSIDYLIAMRNPRALASVYYNTQTKFVEPLLAIWEPAGLNYLAHTSTDSDAPSCPSQLLRARAQEVHYIDTPFAQELSNANTAQQWEQFSRE